MSDDKVRDEAREAAWSVLCRKGDPRYRPSPFTDGFNAGWQAATARARADELSRNADHWERVAGEHEARAERLRVLLEKAHGFTAESDSLYGKIEAALSGKEDA